MTSQQKTDYSNYKEYQKRHQISLDLIKNPESVQNLSVKELTKHYLIVGKIYDLRLKFRNRYFTPEQWDDNHEKYFSYLVNVMNTYEKMLNTKLYEDRHNSTQIQSVVDQVTQISPTVEQDPTKLEPDECPTQTPQPNTCNTVSTDTRNKILLKIQKKKSERQEFEKEWNMQVKKLIKTKEENATEVLETILCTYAYLQMINPEISVEDTIDVVHYFYECIHIAREVMGLKLKCKGTIKIYETFDYSRNLFEFSKYFNKENDEFVDIYHNIKSYDRDLLMKMVSTVLEVTKITTQYHMLHFEMKRFGITALFPSIPGFQADCSKVITKNKACLAITSNEDYTVIIHLFTNNYLSKTGNGKTFLFSKKSKCNPQNRLK